MLHLDTSVSGRWIQLGHLGWNQLSKIRNADYGMDTDGKHHVKVHMKDGSTRIYRGDRQEEVKTTLDREAGR